MKIQMPFNSRVYFRLFERIETTHQDDFYVDSGVEIGDNKHAIGIGFASPLVSARGAEETAPIVEKVSKKEDTPQPQAEEVPTDDNDDVEDDGSVRG
jgi:hypothetical protein